LAENRERHFITTARKLRRAQEKEDFQPTGRGVSSTPMIGPEKFTVLHYLGYDRDRGGIVSVVRALAGTGKFDCLLGVNPGFVQARMPALPTLELPAMEGETISLRNAWRARAVARKVQTWLRAHPALVFHGHTRAGLLVALWLNHWKEKRFVVTVHCYGRRRWFYRFCAQKLGPRLFWLSPAMRKYYELPEKGWNQCLPGCVAAESPSALETRASKSVTLRLGGIGTLVPRKGWHTLVAAIMALPVETRRKFRFRHIGATDGTPESIQYATELRSLTVTAGLEGSIEWLGEKPSSEGLLRNIDWLIVPSEREPFSVSILEALLARVPVVAADSGGTGDLIVPPTNGWLFRTGDSADLARVLASLLEPEVGARVQIDHAGLQRFTAAVSATVTAEVYRQVCDA
jgi:glycosyltransferase involved in cell wall biosynthesis